MVLASIDGPGIWTVIKTNELDRAMVTIGNTRYEMNDNLISVQNGNTILTVGTDAFKMNTLSESLFNILNDLITGITALTVGTSGGPSTPPTNLATFTSLLTRLSNLLTP